MANPPVVINPNAQQLGVNCAMGASNWGSYNVRCDDIVHGMSIVADEDTARFHRALYVTKRTSGSFSIGLVFSTHDHYQRFSDWLMRYGRRRADPNATVGPMRVIVPSRKFDKTAIPAVAYGQGAIPFGDRAGAVTWRTTLQFIGTRDPLDFSNPLISVYLAPSGDPSAPYRYPGGPQLKSGQKGDDWLYNLENSPSPILNTGPQTPNVPTERTRSPGGPFQE